MFTTDEKILMIDTETCNSLDDPLCYDVGFSVIDIFGNCYCSHSYVVADIFIQEEELMKSCYFADKLPQYKKDLKNHTRQLKSFWNIRKKVHQLIKHYKIKRVVAHNSSFDWRSLNLTLRWLTKSKYRYFFPFGVEIWDILKMSRQTFNIDKKYTDFCKRNNFLTSRGKNRLTAEVLYKFITNDLEFEEKHTGLEDVLIEKEIFFNCLKLNPQVDGKLW